MAKKPHEPSGQVLHLVVALVLFAVYVALFIWGPDEYAFLLVAVFVGALVYGLWIPRP